MWTRFMDMHSGGDTKEKPYEYIYIEAPETEAKIIFYNRFGHNPERVTCTCCGDDYSISEAEDLAQATGFDRGCRYAYFDKKGNEVAESKAWKIGVGVVKGYKDKYVEEPNKERFWNNYETLAKYIKRKNVKVIASKDIKPKERVGEVPQEGYVWMG